MIFQYEDKDLEALKKIDVKLKAVIEQVGKIERPINEDLFESLISSIVAQQISGKAYETVFKRLKALTPITPTDILKTPDDLIQACGLSYKKVSYMKHAATYFSHTDINQLKSMSNEDLILVLDDLKGIGRWTAEMLLIFSLNRMDIFSKQDLGIKRGISMIYHHQKITDDLMKKYEKRYSPYGSLASLYLWEISSGQYGHKDYQVK